MGNNIKLYRELRNCTLALKFCVPPKSGQKRLPTACFKIRVGYHSHRQLVSIRSQPQTSLQIVHLIKGKTGPTRTSTSDSGSKRWVLLRVSLRAVKE